MKNYLKYFVLIVLMLTSQQYVFGTREDVSKSIHTPVAGSPVEIGTSTAEDEVILTAPSNVQKDYNLKNRISFGVDMDYSEYVSNHQKVEVFLEVRRFDVNNVALPILNFNLKIDFNHQSNINSLVQDHLDFDEAYRMIFKIKGILVDGNSVNILPKNLFVQGDIYVDRYTTLPTLTPIIQNPIKFLDLDCNNIKEGLEFSWNLFPGAEEYQLEFLHVSNYGYNNSIKSENTLNFDFKNNSTRVTTSSTSYKIALLFDRGWIAYRVRPVGVDINNPSHLIFGDWSIPIIKGTINQIPTINKAQITNAEVHEGSLNWQYSATYAEQGKRKEVITYYDGTLRNRQAVTKVNTNENVIVGETIYDHQGRPAINVLPTPVEIPNCGSEPIPAIKYYPGFNTDSLGNPYSKKNFDLSSGQSCSVGADSMSTDSGSSQYYSPSNPNQALHQAYVPDAKGYPFQQVEYTPDNTGRINRQGGVGPDFQLGSGKETQYLYGNPNQLELNRLFGSEVGYSEHYKKNAVIDANGQVSVSYLDISDKVIATAIAGASPQNMKELESDGAALTMQTNQIHADGSNQVVDYMNNSISISTSVLITSPTNYKIDYEIFTLPMIDSCLDNICVDCVYELELSLKDECGAELLPDTLQNTLIGNFQLDALNNYVFHGQCTDTTSFNSDTTVYLEIGKYTISKKIKILEAAVLRYLELVDTSSCALTYQDFLDDAMADIDTSACNITCDNCIDELGSLQDFLSNGEGTSSDYHLRVEECKDLCKKKISDCEMYFNLMKIDFSPSGQYAEYMNNSTGALNLNKPLSIFNSNNSLPNSNASWRNPTLETSNGIQNIYVDDNGDRTRLFLHLDSINPNIFNPKPLNNSMVQYDSTLGEYYIYPEQLKYVEDFINRFEFSWSASLVRYHPEYCYYESCIQYDDKNASTDAFSSSSFDDLLYNTNSFAKAQAFGFIDANGNPSNWFAPNGGNPLDSLKPWDPFVYYKNQFEFSTCDGFVDDLVNKFNNYEVISGQWMSMAEVAAYTLRCNSNLPATASATCFNFGQVNANGVLDTTLLNSEWNLLKAMYMSAKQDAQQKLANCKAFKDPNCSAYNDCIGNKEYSPFPLFTLFQPVPPYYIFPLHNPSQPCSFGFFQFYRNKVKRFSNHSDVMKENANSTSYELYLQTGQCPNAFAFEHLLNDLVITSNLTNPNYNLNSSAHLAGLFQANNSYNNPGPIPSLDYNATVTINTITADWIDNSNNSTFATMTLNKTSTVVWADVIGIINLQATGQYTFSAEATYLDSIIKVFPITGTITHFKLDGCTFEQECVSNQLALDLTTVFNILGNDNNLFSSSNIDLVNYYSTTAGSTIGLTSLYIENAANVGSSLYWKDLGNGKVKIFDANGVQNDGLYIEMDPTIYQNFGTSLVGFYPIKSTGNFSFEMEVQLNSGVQTIVTGVMYQIHNGDTIGISSGNCGLPVPNSCQGQDYEVFNDLEPLLEDVLSNYDGVSNIDLYSSIYTTPTIISGFGYDSIQTTSVNQIDSLIISSSNCDLILSLNPSQYVQFNNLISISDLELTGATNNQSGYNNFIFLGTFLTPTGNIQDTVYGSTCFSLKDCFPCGSDPSDTIGGNQKSSNFINTIKSNTVLSYTNFNKSVSKKFSKSKNSRQSTCLTNYNLYLACVDSFNIAYTGPYTIIPVPYSEFSLWGCNCVTAYCDKLDNLLNNSTFNSQRDFERHTDYRISCEPCYASFKEYIWFIEDFNTAYSSYNIPIISYAVFQANNYCGCMNEFYQDLLNTVIRNDIQFNSEAEFLQYVDIGRFCFGDCENEYDNYINCVDNFIANYSGGFNFTAQDIVDSTSFISIYNCECVDSYCELLNLTIAEDLRFETQEEFSNFIDYGRNCEGCIDEYNNYLSVIDNYNNSTHTYSITPMSLILFVAYDYCDCVFDYKNLLSDIISEEMEFESEAEFLTYVDLSIVCDDKIDCEQAYESYITCISNFQENYSGEYTIESENIIEFEDFINLYNCECVVKYCELLNLIIDQDIQFESHEEFSNFIDFGRNCEGCNDEYNNYLNVINNYNNTTHTFSVTPMSQVLFVAYDYCDCVFAFENLLNEIISERMQFDSEAEFLIYVDLSIVCDGDSYCETEYSNYLSCVDNFVNNYTGGFNFTAQDIIDSATFNRVFNCECVATYCELLDSILSQNIQFTSQTEFSEFIDYERNCNGCLNAYTNYSNIVNNYNYLTNTYTITPISEVIFVANDYCDCVQAYGQHLTEIIDSNMQFLTRLEFDIYVDLGSVCNNDSINVYDDVCNDAYAQYVSCGQNFVNNTTSSFTLNYMSSYDFEQLGLCSCVDMYCSALDAVLAGIETFNTQAEFDDYLALALDCKRFPPCEPVQSSGVLPMMPTVVLKNDCIETKLNLVSINAQNAYNQYLDSLNTASRNKYVNYCLSTKEKLNTEYDDKQHHYTLYYYDVAGNLIKTIPPEGVSQFDITSSIDVLNMRINIDRTNGIKTVFTSHRLQTRYEYNSLNQLIAQYTPDTDAMDAFEQNLPNGLNNKLVTHKIQMLSPSLGYLAGRVDKRGYLYKTTDGGNTWKRINNLVAADLKKIEMIDATYGVAIGEAGSVLKTSDGGLTWNLLDTWGTMGIISMLNDVAILDPSTSPKVMIVGDNGLAAISIDFTTNNPTFALANGNLYGDVLSVETLLGEFYCTTYESSVEISKFYKFDFPNLWNEIVDVKTNDFSDLHYYANDKAYASDYEGRVYKNTTVSQTNSRWTIRSSNLNSAISKLRFFDEQQGAAIVDYNGVNKLMITIDSAKTWSLISDSSYTYLVKHKDESIIAAASENGRVSVVFPNVTGSGQLAEVVMPNITGGITSLWIGGASAGNLHLIITDQEKIWYTKNALVGSPQWESVNYFSSTASIIKEVSASLTPSGDVYGVAISNNSQTWKFKKEISTNLALEGEIPNSDFKKVVAGDNYFYTLSNTSDILDRINIDASTTYSYSGLLIFEPNHISFHSNTILVAGKNSEISPNFFNIGGSSVDSEEDHTLKVYPDKINVLKKDKVSDILYAYGDDGLIYQYQPSNSTFNRLSNSINENIYDAFASTNLAGVIGGNGLAKITNNFNNSVPIVFTDLEVANGQTVANVVGNTALQGVEWTSNNRLYLVGENGTLLYSPNFTSFTGNDFVSMVNQANINLWDVSEIQNTGKVFVSGDNGLIQKHFGAMGIVNKQIYIPPISDIHFRDNSLATLIANNFVSRTTSNGGGSWKIVLPENQVAPTANYNKVWTLDGGKSLLFGSGNTLINNHSTGVTSYGLSSSNVTAVSEGAISNTILIADNTTIKKVDLTTLSFITLGSVALGVNDIHAFHNGEHIVVGNNGQYEHFDASGVPKPSATGTTFSGNLNSIDFKDYINGVIVGDNGKYYSTINQGIATDGFLDATDWQQRDLSLTDPLGVGNANIYTVAISTSTDILIGGDNTPANSNLQHPYVRKIYDAGGRYSNRFYYDKLGRLVVSQNARQASSNPNILSKYSYTLYDALGRVVEVGEKTENTSDQGIQFKSVFGANVGGVLNPSTINDSLLNLWIVGGGARNEVTKSYYDETIINGLPSVLAADIHTQRQRIIHVTYEETFDDDDQTFDHATHYSYDIHGNVETLLQDNKKMETNFPSLATQRFKRMDYSYDLLSGNVHRMSVQNGEVDQWHHAYTYDADNRIKEVYTNTQAPLTEMFDFTQNKQAEFILNSDWQEDARYYYYDHGPLARAEIGENLLQGVDYYYNLQGWLKGVNSSVLLDENDPGKDSDPNSLNNYFGKDVFGFGLHYYNGDYEAIGGASTNAATSPIAPVDNSSHAALNSFDLYNGNIRYMQTAITHAKERKVMPMLNAYQYDQLNRLIESRSYEKGFDGKFWKPDSYRDEYYNAFQYDAMGNILYQDRHTRDGKQIEKLTYNYQKNNIGGELLRNRLYSLNDGVGDNVDNTDIDDMGFFHTDINKINKDNNYSYDAEGRLIKDRQEEIGTIIWTVSGKVKEIRRDLASEKKNLIFDYEKKLRF